MGAAKAQRINNHKKCLVKKMPELITALFLIVLVALVLKNAADYEYYKTRDLQQMESAFKELMFYLMLAAADILLLVVLLLT